MISSSKTFNNETLALPTFKFKKTPAAMRVINKIILNLNFKSQIVCTNITKNLSTHTCKIDINKGV